MHISQFDLRYEIVRAGDCPRSLFPLGNKYPDVPWVLGITDLVWNSAEMRAIMRNPDLQREYMDEITEAQRSGRLCLPPDADKGRIAHYPGEDFDSPTFERELNKKLAAIDARRRCDAVIKETLDTLESGAAERLGNSAERMYLLEQLKTIAQHTCSVYPANKRPGVDEIKQAVVDAGCTPADIARVTGWLA